MPLGEGGTELGQKAMDRLVWKAVLHSPKWWDHPLLPLPLTFFPNLLETIPVLQHIWGSVHSAQNPLGD